MLTTLMLFAALPPTCILLIVLVYFDASIYLTLLLALMFTVAIPVLYFTFQARLDYQFRTLTNLLEAMVQNDFSMRGRQVSNDDALSELVLQINKLADTLADSRTRVEDTRSLLSKINQHIDVAIFAINQESRISYINPAAEQLLQRNLEEIVGTHVDEHQLQSILTCETNNAIELSFAQVSGHWKIYRDHYREQGSTNTLVFITDVKRILRSEEKRAWRDLVRVLSHEINNSLTPIASMAETISSMMKSNEETLSREDVIDSLGIINERANALRNFVDSYRKLTHLPDPQIVSTDIHGLALQTAQLMSSQIQIQGDSQHIPIDPIQFEQLLINLFKNAIEACSNSEPTDICMSWTTQNDNWIMQLSDNGAGLSNMDNLFTPFYTTKAKGSGIGLALCRQIVDAHGGEITIRNKKQFSGCVVTVSIPIIE